MFYAHTMIGPTMNALASLVHFGVALVIIEALTSSCMNLNNSILYPNITCVRLVRRCRSSSPRRAVFIARLVMVDCRASSRVHANDRRRLSSPEEKT